MNVSFNGIGEMTATFEVSGSVKAGQAVKLVGNGKVGACSALKDVPVGMAVKVQDGYAAVQVKGYMKLPAATGLTVGYHMVSTTAAGAVQSGTEGRPAMVLDVESGVCGLVF